jgi:hypothetical protein
MPPWWAREFTPLRENLAQEVDRGKTTPHIGYHLSVKTNTEAKGIATTTPSQCRD